MAFDIRKGIPTPPKCADRIVYPFHLMEVGDCFDAPRDMGRVTNGGDARQNSVASRAWAYAKRKNPTAKFTTRIIDENTVRCWRVA